MSKDSLIHIRVGKEMKKQMQKLIDMGMFSTEAEIAREGLRNVILKYMKEAGFGSEADKEESNENKKEDRGSKKDRQKDARKR